MNIFGFKAVIFRTFLSDFPCLMYDIKYINIFHGIAIYMSFKTKSTFSKKTENYINKRSFTASTKAKNNQKDTCMYS